MHVTSRVAPSIVVALLVCGTAYSQTTRKRTRTTKTSKGVVASLLPKETYDKFSDRTTVTSAQIVGWPGFWFGANYSFHGTLPKDPIESVRLVFALGSDYWPSVTVTPRVAVLADNKRLTFSQEMGFIAPLSAAGLVFYTYALSLTIQEFKQLACADVTEMQFAEKSFRSKPADTIALRGVLYKTGNDCKRN